MGKQIAKKLLAVSLVATMLLSQSGCAGKQEKKTEQAVDTSNCTYRGTEISADYAGDYVSTMDWVAGKLYVSGFDNEGRTVLYRADADGTNAEEISLPTVADTSYVTQLRVGADENVVFAEMAYNESGSDTTMALVKTDATGKQLWRQDVTKELHLGENDYLQNMLVDEEGNIYLMLETRIVVLDKDAKLQKEMQLQSMVDASALTKDGKVVCGFCGEKGERIQVIDTASWKLLDAYELPISYFPSSECLINGAGAYDVYYWDSTALYGYDFSKKKADCLMDFVASNISVQDVGDVIAKEDGSFLIVENSIEGKQTIQSYAKVDADKLANRTVLTLAGTFVSDDVKRAVIAFNKANDAYQIEVRDYANTENPEQMLATEIAAGNIPDLISLTDISTNQYIAKGILADLTPYYEKENLQSALLPTVAKAMQTDGKYYYVASYAYLYTLAGNADVVGTTQGWTIREMLEMLKQQKGKMDALAYMERSSLLYTMMGSTMDTYVDWSNGTCDFESDEFKDVLTLCKEYGEPASMYDGALSTSKRIYDGQVFMLETTLDMNSVVMYNKMFHDKVCYIGYPVKEGIGSFFNFETQYGISSQCENKDAAWEFLSQFMTKEYQVKNNYGQQLPTRQDAYDMLKRECTTTESYEDEFGKMVEPQNGTWGYDDLDVEIKPLTDEEVARFEDVLNATTRVIDNDDVLLDIVIEEAEAYFAGDKSVDAVCKVIQNRISTYVNENR